MEITDNTRPYFIYYAQFKGLLSLWKLIVCVCVFVFSICAFYIGSFRF